MFKRNYGVQWSYKKRTKKDKIEDVNHKLRRAEIFPKKKIRFDRYLRFFIGLLLYSQTVTITYETTTYDSICSIL